MRQTFDEKTTPAFGQMHLPPIRAAMADQGLDGFLVPHEDEHQNEYLPAANDRLGWLTGFTGSAGAAVVLKEKAAIFVDGRYAVQVLDQVDTNLFDVRDLVEGGVAKYLEDEAKTGWTIGYDPRLHSPDALDRFKTAAETAGAALKPVALNPIDVAWGAERPAQPTAPVVPHLLQYTGEDSASKRARLAKALTAQKADAAVITAPASIAWLFNIRGGDVIRTPLPLAQALLRADGSADIFLDPVKITADLPAWLGNEVALKVPADLEPALKSLNGQRVLVDPAISSAWYFQQLESAGAEILRAPDPAILPRATKNKVEIAGMQKAHEIDAAALCRALHWLGTEAQTTLPDEITIAKMLEQCREDTGVLQDLSFDAITGAASNAAIMHYRVTDRLNRKVEKGSVILVDSGGQYLEGTTDVTRTVAIGEPSAELKKHFTLVLKGHLALTRVRFPAGTVGIQLDALARMALWQYGMDYDHGTGHGVGQYLGVHEGPHSISKRHNNIGFQPGMVVSNEPGFYLPGRHGIRIENLQYVTDLEEIPGGDRPVMGFTALTLAPIDRNLIDRDLLNAEERTQLDAYHARVRDTVGPHVPADTRAWLEDVCAPI